MKVLPFLSRLLVLPLLLLTFEGAAAAPVTWTLNNVTTNDGSGGTANWFGTFNYDADTNTYSSINIGTDLSFFAGQTFSSSNDTYGLGLLGWMRRRVAA